MWRGACHEASKKTDLPIAHAQARSGRSAVTKATTDKYKLSRGMIVYALARSSVIRTPITKMLQTSRTKTTSAISSDYKANYNSNTFREYNKHEDSLWVSHFLK